MNKQQNKKQSKLLWYFNRLKTMNLPEIQHRVWSLLRKKYERRVKTGSFPKLKKINYPESILTLPIGLEPSQADTYKIFGVNLDLTKPIDWHEDIMSQRKFPLKHAHSIDTRTEKNGVAKVVWEVNRLQFLTSICMQYRYAKDEKYLRRFVDMVTDWQKANPYLVGVNWYSNIEINLRIITWFLCWEILEASKLCRENAQFKTFTDTIWLPLIYLHAQYCDAHPSKFSSSNNHLIAEASGLFIAGAYWDFPESKKWVRKGQKILEREIQLQHSPNGINKEEASEYIQFITDFFLIAYLVGERRGNTFSKAYSDMLKKILHYIYHLMDRSGRAPYYGDDDDGHTFVLSNGRPGNNFQSLLASGAILFKDPLLKAKAGALDLKNKVLFGEEGVRQYERLTVVEEAPTTRLFPQEGHFFIKKGNKKEEIYLHVDAAPLGYLSIAAHGHADALSFFLHVDGAPYIIDVGTYTYHSEPEWRAYFKGTLAHNTIRVDRQDQAVNAGPCLWLNHYEPKLARYEDNEQETIVDASHNGYAHLGVAHRRTYRFLKEKDLIEIVDYIDCGEAQRHAYEFPLHFHPEVAVTQIKSGIFELSQVGARKVEIHLDQQLDARLIKGSVDPILGWNSPSFLQKEPTTTMYSQIEKTGSFKLTTNIKIVS